LRKKKVKRVCGGRSKRPMEERVLEEVKEERVVSRGRGRKSDTNERG